MNYAGPSIYSYCLRENFCDIAFPEAADQTINKKNILNREKVNKMMDYESF